jgi:hypothetical protein
MTATSSTSQSTFCEYGGIRTRAPGPTTDARDVLMNSDKVFAVFRP